MSWKSLWPAIAVAPVLGAIIGGLTAGLFDIEQTGLGRLGPFEPVGMLFGVCVSITATVGAIIAALVLRADAERPVRRILVLSVGAAIGGAGFWLVPLVVIAVAGGFRLLPLLLQLTAAAGIASGVLCAALVAPTDALARPTRRRSTPAA